MEPCPPVQSAAFLCVRRIVLNFGEVAVSLGLSHYISSPYYCPYQQAQAAFAFGFFAYMAKTDIYEPLSAGKQANGMPCVKIFIAVVRTPIIFCLAEYCKEVLWIGVERPISRARNISVSHQKRYS